MGEALCHWENHVLAFSADQDLELGFWKKGSLCNINKFSAVSFGRVNCPIWGFS